MSQPEQPSDLHQLAPPRATEEAPACLTRRTCSHVAPWPQRSPQPASKEVSA
jgi:hypothetical protein